MKVVRLSLIAAVASSMLIAGNTTVPPTVEVVEVEKDWGDIFGQSRTFYIDRTYNGSINNNRSSLATGGYIGYMTPEYHGFTAAIAAYGTYGFDIHSEDAKVAGSASYDPSLYGDAFENYGFIGQAYVNFKMNNTNIKIGRQRLDTPLAGADDARMLPNLFEAAVLSNTDIENTTLILGHVTRETVGTFGNVYGTPSMLSLQSGYGLGYKLGTDGEFVNMGSIALGDADADGNFVDNETDGVTALAAIYSNGGLKLQAWDYIAWDILNAIYLQADYSMDMDAAKIKLSAQYINESDMGDALAGKVDSNYLAGKITAILGDFSAYAAYSTTDSNADTVTNGGILTPWGGMPAFTQGMVTRHQFLADTTAFKVAATYKLADYGASASVYYTSFDVGADNSYLNGRSWTAKESGFDIKYKVAQVDGLNLRFRANFPEDFGYKNDEPFGWDEYRFIINYNF